MSSRSTQIIGGPDREHAKVSSTGELHVSLIDPVTGNPVVIDPATGQLVATDHNLVKIHAGQHWSVSSVDQAVAGSGVVEMLLRVPSGTEAHVHIAGSVSVNMLGELFDGPTTSADGTAIPSPNRNRSSSNTSNMLVFDGPTVTVDGTRLMEVFMPGGSGKQAGGGTGESNSEWVLDAGDYLLRITNVTTTNNSIAGIVLEWHETAV